MSFPSAWRTRSSASPWTGLNAARAILHEGMESGFSQLDVDNFWMTSVIAYVILALELDDREAAADLLPLLVPHATEVSFNGVTSQGPVAAYAGSWRRCWAAMSRPRDTCGRRW